MPPTANTSGTSPSTPASQYLDTLGIPYHFFQHTGPVSSLEQAAAERGQRPGQVVRSILFRLEENRFCLVLAGGPGQVSWPALRKHFNLRRLTMATPEEVLQVTGYRIGAVSPFGWPRSVPRGSAGPVPPGSTGYVPAGGTPIPHDGENVPLGGTPVLVDRGVLAETEVSLGSGVRGLALVMLSADLLRALPGAVVGEFLAE